MGFQACIEKNRKICVKQINGWISLKILKTNYKKEITKKKVVFSKSKLYVAFF